MHPAISWKHSNNSARAASVFLIYLKISAKYRTGIIDVGTPLWDWKRVRVTVPPPCLYVPTGQTHGHRIYILFQSEIFNRRGSLSLSLSLSLSIWLLRNRLKETMRASRAELTRRKGLRFPLDGKKLFFHAFSAIEERRLFRTKFKGNFGFHRCSFYRWSWIENVIQGSIEL